MERDYTEETKNRLLKQIDQVSEERWSPVTDAIGDVFMHLGKWTGLISVHDNMSNIKRYQKQVLDMTDMSKKELREIFKNVYDIDKEYKKKFSAVNERQSTYNTKINMLTGMIAPNFSITDASSIKAQLGDINKKLKDSDKKISETYIKELDYAAKQASLKSVKGFFSSLANTAVDVLTLPSNIVKNLVTGNIAGIGADCWHLIGDTLSIGGNLAGSLSIFSCLSGDVYNKEYLLSETEKYAGAKNLTDLLKAEDFPDWLVNISEGLDRAADAASIITDVKGWLKDPSSIVDLKFGFTKYKPIRKASMAKDYVEDYRKWQTLYRNLYRNYHVSLAKNLKTAYGYVDNLFNLIDGNVEDVAEGTVKEVTENVIKPVKTEEKLVDIFEYIKSTVIVVH